MLNIHQFKICFGCLKRTIAKRLDNPQYNLAATRKTKNVAMPDKCDFMYIWHYDNRRL